MAIKYSSDVNLIKGAAAAYKNYETELLSQSIKNITAAAGQAVKAYNVKQELKNKAKLLKEKQDAEWDKTTSEVMKTMGSFKTTTDYEYVIDVVKEIKEDYLLAQETDDKKGMADAYQRLNNQIARAGQIKEFRLSISDPEKMSNALKNTGGNGNNGQQQEIITNFLAENYTINENGKYVFKDLINPNTGEAYQLTFEEVEEIYIPKDDTASKAFGDLLSNYSSLAQTITNDDLKNRLAKIVPEQTNSLRAFVADPIFADQTFRDMLDTDSTIDQEIKDNYTTNKLVDKNEDGELSPDEISAFKDTIVDPYADFWVKEDGEPDFVRWKEFCRNIVLDKLSNAVVNNRTNQARLNKRSDYEN